MSESLGQYFRRTREQKGWTLEQAAAKIRILPEYLRAVEEDNYEALPEEVFAKGFVRSYARSLSLDEGDVLQRFDESGGKFYAKRHEREQLKQRLQEEARRKKTNQLIVAGIVGAALLALLLVTGQERERPRSSAERQQEPAPPLPKPPVAIGPALGPPIAPPSPSVPEPPRPDPAGRIDGPPATATDRPKPEAPPLIDPGARIETPVREPAPSASLDADRSFTSPVTPLEGIVPQSKKLVLEVEAVERAWVMVKADHNPAQDVMLAPGDHVRWSANDRLTLTLGNAGGVRISLNGKPQGPYGSSGTVVKDLIFTR